MTPQQVVKTQEWIEALESGEFDHCKYSYKNVDGCHCAIGVAFEIFKHNSDSYDHTGSEIFPERQVQQETGLNACQMHLVRVRSDKETDYQQAINVLKEIVVNESYKATADVSSGDDTRMDKARDYVDAITRARANIGAAS